MTSRSDRIDRIQVLLDDRRHPERRVGLFSATNLTRLALRFGAMIVASGAVHLLVGGTILEVPLTAIAVGAVDVGVTRLWARIGDGVRRGWNMLGIIVACILMLAFALGQASPDSFLVKSISVSGKGWLDKQNAKLDQKGRSRMIPVDAAAASGDQWQLVVDNRGGVAHGTLQEATSWCTQLGTEWHLPPGLGQWPKLSSYPRAGTIFYVWSAGGGGVQIGDGQAPAVAVSGGDRATMTRGVLCIKDKP